jgi:hypothetical protein
MQSCPLFLEDPMRLASILEPSKPVSSFCSKTLKLRIAFIPAFHCIQSACMHAWGRDTQTHVCAASQSCMQHQCFFHIAYAHTAYVRTINVSCIPTCRYGVLYARNQDLPRNSLSLFHLMASAVQSIAHDLLLDFLYWKILMIS